MLGIIGGSGLYQLSQLSNVIVKKINTPFGCDDVEVHCGSFGEVPVAFITRHGQGHSIAPHNVNYRANIWALQCVGVSRILAINVVGGISQHMAPQRLIVPDQVIDYTYGREHTFYDGIKREGVALKSLDHIDFTYPFSPGMVSIIRNVLPKNTTHPLESVTYGCTQGPRLESAAEIKKLARDGCDIVGMTVMPEAALAAELSIPYASLCLVANWGAGIVDEVLHIEEIMAVVHEGIGKIENLLPSIGAALKT